MALARYKTVGEILNKAGLALGLEEVADPVASSDAEWKRLVQLLNDAGQDLAQTYEWSNLLVEKIITGDGVTTTYDLPADFAGMVEQTGWNRNTLFPLAGPLSPQLWQYRTANAVKPIYAEFRMDQNQIRFLQAIASGQVVAFEYKSRAWLRPAASGLGNGNTLGIAGSDEVAVTGDFVLFDPLLARTAVVLAWREENGFDTTKAQEAYQRALDRAQDRSQSMPVLRLSRRRSRIRFISGSNVPDGSWQV